MIDLRDGRAVRGRSGDRDRYEHVVSRLGGEAPRDLSHPPSLLRAYRKLLRAPIVYVADLDRILRRGNNDASLLELIAAAPEVRFLWDGGLTDPTQIEPFPVVPILATEMLSSPADLGSRAATASGEPVVLGLDLGERGIIARSASVAALGEAGLLAEAGRCGLRSAIVLLLRRVGTGCGLPRQRLRRLRDAAPGLDLIAGGGIDSLDDLAFLRDSGFTGALLATALHEGRIRPSELDSEGFLC